MPEDAATRKEQNPLQGFVLCCTSITPDQRGKMAAIAQQMGAAHKLDLTSDVTHLLVGNVDTPKYKYVARERPDIKVLDPTWLEAVRLSWMEGGDTDVAALEEQYRLPTLYNLQICITGFDDLQLRTAISDSISNNGAKYHGDLTRQVTHLIAAAPQGKKYEYAGSWGIRIVSLRWLEDSISRGMVLDESSYHPALAADQQGVGAMSLNVLQRNGKRQRQEDEDDAPIDPSKRKLRRTISAKLESHNDQLWNEIGNNERTEDQNKPTKRENINESHRVARSIAVEESFVPTAPLKENDGEDTATMSNIAPTSKRSSRAGRLFSSDQEPYAFFIDHFDSRKTAILQSHLESNGAQLLSMSELKYLSDATPSEADRAIVIVIPHDISSKDYEGLESKPFWPSYASLVSDWWVEKCLYDKVLEDKSIARYHPFMQVPIPGFAELTICPTSFSGIDLLHFSKAVKLSGATYNEWLKPNTSVLVSDSLKPSADKIQFALKQDIPVVSSTWFWASIEARKKLPFHQYLVAVSTRAQTSQQKNSARSQTPSSDAEGRRTSARSFQGTRKRTPGQLETKCGGGADTQKSQPVSKSHGSHSMKRHKRVSRKPTPLRELSQGHNSQEIVTLQTDENATFAPGDTEENSFAAPEQLYDECNDGENHDKENGSQSSHALNSAIEQILAQKRTTASELRSSSSLQDDGNPNSLSRRHRPLGRASSNPSSIGQSVLSRPSAEKYSFSVGKHHGNVDIELEVEAQELEKKVEQPPLSQTLTYEDPEALAAREKLMKRIGKNSSLDGERLGMTGMTRVESVGRMKQIPSIAEERPTRRTGRKK